MVSYMGRRAQVLYMNYVAKYYEFSQNICLFFGFWGFFCMKSSKPSMCLSSLQRTSVHTSASQFPLQVHSDWAGPFLPETQPDLFWKGLLPLPSCLDFLIFGHEWVTQIPATWYPKPVLRPDQGTCVTQYTPPTSLHPTHTAPRASAQHSTKAGQGTLSREGG